MARTTETGPGNQEENEVKNKKSTQYVFPENHYDEFIEKRLDGNLSYFSGAKFDSQKNVDDFWSFIETHHPEDLTKTEKNIHEQKLKRKILQAVAPIDDAMIILKNRFESEFSLKPEQIQKLEQILSKNKLSDLKYYIISSAGREKLLKKENKTLGEVVPKDANKNDEQLLNEIFGSLDISNIKNNADFMESLYAFMHAKKVTLSDVKTLFSGLSDAHQVKLLQYFIPAISLQESLDFGVYTKEEAYKYLEAKLEKYIDNEEERKHIAQNIELSSVMISTSDLKKLNTIGESFLKKFVQAYEQDRLDALKNDPITSKKEFLDIVQNSEKISPQYKKEAQKIEQNGYYQIKTGDEITTFYIKSLPDVGENAEVVNVTVGKDGKSITKGNSGKTDVFSYNDFFELLEISTKNTKIGLEIFSNGTFKQKNPEEVPQTVEEILTPDELKKAMDEVDPDGKNIPLEFTSFGCLPEDTQSGTRGDIFDNQIYQIYKIEKGDVVLEKEKLTFSEFILAFRERKAKRFKTIPTGNDFVAEMKNSPEYKDVFEKVECKNGDFIKKSEGKDEDQKVEYFISEKGNKAIQVKKAGHGSITFIEGDFKEATKEEKEKGKMGTFGKDGIKTGTVSYGIFAKYLEGKGLKPHLKKTSIDHAEEVKAKELKSKKGLLATLGSFASPKELISALKQVTSAVEHHLEEGNKLKAAKLALAMGKFLPQSVRLDLQNMVESEQKKSMEEIMDKLKNMNSTQMVDTIFKYVENSAPGDPKLEAAMMTMMEKYGNLYNKAESKRGNYIWYQALGGKVGDKLFMDIKKQCEEASLQNSKGGKPQPVPFTEEKLVEALLKKQVNPDSEYYPKRRSKLDKAFGAAMNSGIEEEMKDGENKTADMMTLNGRLGYIMSEFAAGGYANGVGGIQKVWAKGGGPTEMNAPAFVLTMSGITKDFPEALLNKLIGLSWDSPYPMMLFNFNDEKRNLFQNTVKDLVIQKNNPKMKTAFDEAMEQKGGKKIDGLYSFWMTYGDELSKDLTLRIPDGNTLMLMKEKGENQNFSDYVGWYNTMMTDDEYNMKTDDISNGRYGTGGVGHPINPEAGKKYYEWFFDLNTTGSYSKDGLAVFGTAIQQITDLKNNGDISLEDKRILYKQFISNLEPAVREGVQGRGDTELFKKSNIALRLRSIGVEMSDFVPNETTDTKKGETGAYRYVESENFQKYMDRCFERFIRNSSVEDEFDHATENTKKSALDILEGFRRDS